MIRVALRSRSRFAPARIPFAGGLGPPLSLLALLVGCRAQPKPPAVPAWGGPDAGQPRDTLVFWAAGEDANGGLLSYRFDWGDGSEPGWGAELPVGETIRQRHIYPDTGRYQVAVRARDETGRESDWTPPRVVAVTFFGPVMPAPPVGPGQSHVDTLLAFSIMVAHVAGDSVSVQFDWGDTLGAWGGYVGSGSSATDTHRYARTGVFHVRARGRDKAGHISPWSDPVRAAIGLRPVEAPTNLRLSQVSGLFVRLRWETGRNHDSVRYAVWFRDVDSSRFIVADSVVGDAYTHDPFGSTGEYALSAFYSGDTAWCADTLSTIPVYSDTIVLTELNAGDSAGYGWDGLTRVGSAHAMQDTTQAAFVDWYFTDLTPGHNGPGYYVASPFLGPDDPGGAVPPGAWRRTRLLGILGNTRDPLPEYDSLYYQTIVDVNSFVSNVAVYTPEGYYALVLTYGPNSTNGTLPVATWFQSVRGLRLIRHRDDDR